MEIISREFRGIEINFSTEIDENIYLNATQTAKKFKKKPDNWLRNKDVKDYINAIETRFSNLRNELVVVKQGGNSKEQGTWIHKKLIIAFARWLSPEFAVWCDEVIEEILQTGSYSLKKEEKVQFDFEEIQKVVKIGIEFLNEFDNLDPVKQIKLDNFVKQKSDESLLEDFGISFENHYFLPTEIGNMIGMSGAEINLILEKKGFQFRDENGVWKPTSSGKEFCLEIGNKFNQLKWRISTIL
jgi:frataxin-like iron-binding protein CyaY